MQMVSTDKLVLMAALALVCRPTVAKCGGYMGCQDQSPSRGYEGVMATIEFDVSNVSYVLYVWCGIDDGHKKAGCYAQAGWEKYMQLPYRVYLEYITEGGVDAHRVGPSPPPGTANYEVRRDTVSGLLLFKLNGLIIHSLPWYEFDSKKLCNAYYGAEMIYYHDDFVPGTADDPCDFTNIKVIKRDDPFVWPAELSYMDWNVPTGSIVKWGSGNFYIWDARR